jgi:hypothetical protein
MLLKHSPVTGPLASDNRVLEWLSSHGKCHPNKDQIDLGGNPGFTLHTEDSIWLDPEKQNHTERDDTGTGCCPKSRASFGWNHSTDCPNWVMVD